MGLGDFDFALEEPFGVSVFASQTKLIYRHRCDSRKRRRGDQCALSSYLAAKPFRPSPLLSRFHRMTSRGGGLDPPPFEARSPC